MTDRLSENQFSAQLGLAHGLAMGRPGDSAGEPEEAAAEQEQEQVPGSNGEWADGDRRGKLQEPYLEQ